MKDNITLVFGDSIVYGVGDTKFGGWVNRLKIYLSKKFNNQYVFNLGIPGQNSNDILNRIELEIKNRFSKDDSFTFIFAFGIKDALLLSENEKHIEVFENNLKKIINIAQNYSDDIHCLGLLDVNITKRINYKYESINKIENCIETISAQENVDFIKIRKVISLEDLIDGLHPNINGHKKLKNYIAKKIYKLGV